MTEKEATKKLLNEWRTSAFHTISTLWAFSHLMRTWQRFPPDQKEFCVMLKLMRDAGLEGWLDWHPLDLDALAEKLNVND